MRLGLERAPLLELLPNPAHRRHTKTKKLRDVAGAFALLIEMDDPLASRKRYCAHEPHSIKSFPSVKLHDLWKCSRLSAPSRRSRAPQARHICSFAMKIHS